MNEKREVIIMNCPVCGSSDLKTRETRNPIRLYIDRRKKCADCGHFFKTVEHIFNDDVPPNIIIAGERSWFRKSLLQNSICEIVSYERVFLGFSKKIAEDVQDLILQSEKPITGNDIEDVVIKALKSVGFFQSALAYAIKYFPLFSNGDNMFSTLKALNKCSRFTL